MNRPLKLSLAVALALVSGQAFALGLGPIVVKSKLNEPLVAEIAINDTGTEEATTLNAALASADAMKKVGFDTSSLAVPLDFTVTESNGRRVIRVTSRDAVRDPLLSFLVEVNWSKGRMLREYNVLLDPPIVAPAIAGSRAVTTPVREPERAPTKPAAAPPAKPTPAAPVAAAPSTPAPKPETPTPTETTPAAPSGAPGEYGPVASGETLWEIASRTRPEKSIDVNRMMVSLLRANPKAFYRDNVNTLKRGAVLRIPSADEVRALTSTEAAAAIAAQNTEFGNAPPPEKVADSGKTPAPTTTKPVATTTPTPPSHLELVPPKAGAGKSGADKPGTAGGTDASATIRADLARTKEQLSAREQEANDLKSRVKDLEKLKADNERLISLKNSQIADLQQKLADLNRQIDVQKRDLAKAQTAPAATPPPPTTTPATTTPSTTTAATPPHTTNTPPTTTTTTPPPTAVVTEPPKTEPPKVEPPKTEPPKVEPPKTETPPPTATTPVEPADSGAKITPLPDTKPATPVPMPATETEPPPSGPAWYANPFVLGGALLLVLAGVAAAMLGRRKKAIPVAEDLPPEAPSLGDQFRAGPYAGAAAGAVAAAEARESDEERELLERLAADPTDMDVQLELLRLYYLRRDVDKFEQAANAMYAQLPDPSVAAWHRVAEMGRELLPNDPLFTEPPPSGESSFAQEATYVTPSPVASSADAARTEYEFDFDTNRAEPAAASATAAGLAASRAAAEAPRMSEPEPEPSFDFDLAEPAAPPPPPARHEPEPEPMLVSEPIPEFDFDTEIERPQLDSIATAEFKRPSEPQRASTPADTVFGDDDAVGTKLDLARAYLDMGDPDGARSMLQEVLAEGNNAQKDEARKLLTEIG
jgi:pilus assembly protein FimV